MVARFSPQPSTATIDELLTLIENNGAAVVVRMSEAEADVARFRDLVKIAVMWADNEYINYNDADYMRAALGGKE
jgi:hypothetical protein